MFEKPQEVTICFVMPVCPYGTTLLPLDEFSEVLYLSIFQKSVRKIQVSLKFKNNKYFT
jgi:hypothetical protein